MIDVLTRYYEPLRPEATEVVNRDDDADFQTGDLSHPAEFWELVGGAEEENAELLDGLAFLPRAGRVNVNTATRDVLTAVSDLPADRVGELVALRDASPFDSVPRFVDAVRALAGDAAAEAIPVDLLGVTSDWFVVITQVPVEDVTHHMRTVLHRDPDDRTVRVFAREAEARNR